MIVGHAFEEAPHRDLGDQPRELGAQAEVLARAEAQMPERAALDVVAVGIGKLAPVAVGRAIGQHDLVARLEALTMELDRPHDGALEALRRGVEAQ